MGAYHADSDWADKIHLTFREQKHKYTYTNNTNDNSNYNDENNNSNINNTNNDNIIIIINLSVGLLRVSTASPPYKSRYAAVNDANTSADLKRI